jgi:hypothetical protein
MNGRMRDNSDQVCYLIDLFRRRWLFRGGVRPGAAGSSAICKGLE